MTPRLALAALLLLCASQAGAAASCTEEAYTPSALSENCDKSENTSSCSQYYSEFVKACTEEFSAAATTIENLPKDPKNRTDAERVQAAAAKARYLNAASILFGASSAITEIAETGGEDGQLAGLVALEASGHGMASIVNTAFETFDPRLPPEFKSPSDVKAPKEPVKPVAEVLTEPRIESLLVDRMRALEVILSEKETK